MRKFIPILFTSIGGLLGSIYGAMSVIAAIPAFIVSDLPVPTNFVDTYFNRYLYVLAPIVLVLGGLGGKWRADAIASMGGWQSWAALILVVLIVAVFGYAASMALFFLTA